MKKRGFKNATTHRKFRTFKSEMSITPYSVYISSVLSQKTPK